MSNLISLIVPCYNEQEALPFFYQEVCKVAADLKARHEVDVEFIFINDGSADQTLRLLRELAGSDERVKYISFSRNFGKESAIYAGLHMPAATNTRSSVRICRIRLPCFLKCTSSSGMALTTALGRDGSPARASRRSAPSLPGASTGLSTGSPKWIL